MRLLAGIIKKEVLEIIRDVQSLFLLILMPATFILVMSLSMQSLFQPGSDFTVKIIVNDLDRSPESARYIGVLKKIKNITVVEQAVGLPEEAIRKKITEGDCNFGLVLTRHFTSAVRNIAGSPGEAPMVLYIEPAIQSSIQMGVKNQLLVEFLKLRTGTFFDANAALAAYAGIKKNNFFPEPDAVILPRFAVKSGPETAIPNASQQNVPAWLVFSMYFIVMPISLIFHTEKNHGTLSRIRSIAMDIRYLIAGKIVSYYIISMIQVVCMLFVGRFLVPLLGGDVIGFGSSPAGLFLIASCVGINSIAYGLLISAVSKNTQMAGSLGVILIIIFSAIGGIMVPKFVMPAAMQSLSVISPLAWGLEGFLDIMLRNGGIEDILFECGLLILTSGVMLVATGIILKKKIV